MNVQEIHDSIKDYSWMMKYLINKRLETVNNSASLIGKYGIEATLPKPNNISDPVYQEIMRIEKYEKNTKKIRKKVLFIQKHSKCIGDIKNKLVLDSLLDGLPMREIATQLDMSLSDVHRRKEIIASQMHDDYLKQSEQTGNIS